jgi:hypothetical protein
VPRILGLIRKLASIFFTNLTVTYVTSIFSGSTGFGFAITGYTQIARAHISAKSCAGLSQFFH